MSASTASHRRDNPESPDRRRFLSTTAAAAGAFTIVGPSLVRGAAANSKIQLGLIGCGGRGTWIADLFRKHGGYELVAAADYFRDRVDAFGQKHGATPARRYTGLDCHRKMLADGVDAVAIISPPYFHPDQAAAAVEAGVHVYLAKPIAVDAPGCRRIADLGRRATQKQRAFLVDFQTRNDPFYIEAIRRVHEGALGEPAFGEASYHDNRLGLKATPDGSPESRLRNWVFWKDLSGDIITEQNIHTLDVMSWIMAEPPLRAWGAGGRRVRTDVGDCWDHFVLTFEYPGGIGIGFSSRQFNGHGSKPDGIRNRMFGSEGVLETQYGGQVLIRGEHFYRGGRTNEIYREGAERNIAAFHEDITGGRFDNPTVEPSVRSNLVTILGRTAAYEHRVVGWDEIASSERSIEADLSGLEA